MVKRKENIEMVISTLEKTIDLLYCWSFTRQRKNVGRVIANNNKIKAKY